MLIGFWEIWSLSAPAPFRYLKPWPRFRMRYQVQHRRVLYDRAAVIEQLNRIAHPGRAYLIKHLSHELSIVGHPCHK
jgi:hypothetical protein